MNTRTGPILALAVALALSGCAYNTQTGLGWKPDSAVGRYNATHPGSCAQGQNAWGCAAEGLVR